MMPLTYKENKSYKKTKKFYIYKKYFSTDYNDDDYDDDKKYHNVRYHCIFLENIGELLIIFVI